MKPRTSEACAAAAAAVWVNTRGTEYLGKDEGLPSAMPGLRMPCKRDMGVGFCRMNGATLP